MSSQDPNPEPLPKQSNQPSSWHVEIDPKIANAGVWWPKKPSLPENADPGAQRLLKLFNDADSNKDGYINFAEFRSTIFNHSALANDLWVRNIPSHTLFAFFSNIDENNDHLISFDELLHAYPSISRTGFLSTLSSFVSVYSPDFNNEFSVRPEVESTKRGWDAWLPSILGGLAGSISKTATSPLERLRVYYQTGYPGGESVSAERNQMRDAVKRIYQEGGLTAFWRGNLLNCIKIAPETAINFAVFDRAQNYFKETRGNVGNLERLTNGAIAGIVSQASVYAIDTIRTRMMSNLDATSVGGNHPPASVRAVFREIQAQSGIAGFYRGIVPASIGIAPYSAIYFWSFETLKSWYAHKSGLESAGSYAILGMGSVAAIVAGVSTYPFGLIRTRMMAQGSKAHPFTYKSTMDCVKQTQKREGVPGMYRGLTITLAKSVPSSAVSFYCFELGKSWLARKESA